MKKLNLFWLLLSLTAICFQLPATDAEATAEYEAGLKEYRAGKYYDAGKHFRKAREFAKSPVIRANSLLAQAGSWKMCEMRYWEFKAYDELLNDYPDYINYQETIDRIFDIAADFHAGKQDPAFYALRWIPWLTDEDRSIEVLKNILQRAPFSSRAPSARLLLAFCYAEKNKRKEAVEELKTIIRDYPGTEERKYAMLALADELFNLAKKGDGDGRYVSEANEWLYRFKKEYPAAAEESWVDRKLLAAKDIQAERLRLLAAFYQKHGRNAAARRYLAQILRDYPDSLSANESEKKLSEISPDFVPEWHNHEPARRLEEYRIHKIPQEAKRILLLPGENGNHYLLTVPDISNETGKSDFEDKNKK